MTSTNKPLDPRRVRAQCAAKAHGIASAALRLQCSALEFEHAATDGDASEMVRSRASLEADWRQLLGLFQSLSFPTYEELELKS